MRKRTLAMASAILMLSMLAGLPNAAAGCGYEGADLTKKNVQPATENGDANTVALGEFNQYTVEFGAGLHHIVLLSPIDVDITVCKGNASPANWQCHSENPGGVDGCLADGLEGNPGMGNSFTGEGTFKVQVRHCTNTECGYPADAPDIPYVIAWFSV